MGGLLLLVRGDDVVSFYKRSSWKTKREKVLRRDQYLCQECKRYGRSTAATTVHHIHPLEHYPELALVSANLLSLCGACHDAMHDRKTGSLSELGWYWKERVRDKFEEWRERREAVQS